MTPPLIDKRVVSPVTVAEASLLLGYQGLSSHSAHRLPALPVQSNEGIAGELNSGERSERGRIRVAFVIDCIQDWNLGGTERQLVHLIRALVPQGFEPAIFVLQDSPGALAKEIGCSVYVLGKGASQSRVRSLFDLRRALRMFNPHIVQTFYIDGTFYGAVAAWLNRVPVIVQSRRNAGHWQKLHHTMALRALNHFIDFWQCNSQFVAAKLQNDEGVPAERVSVLPNSIDVTHFRPPTPDERLAARQRLGLPVSAPVFVVVSTLRPVKGLSAFITAAATVRKSLPEACFLIVGEGPDRKILTDQIEGEVVRGAVRLEGAQADIRPWLAAADLAVLTSFSESSSNALLEYMAMGLPTVVSDIPANHELVDGEFFEAGDPRGLAEGILSLWNHKERMEELARRNRETAMKYGALAFSEQVQNYYLQLGLPHCKMLPKARVLPANLGLRDAAKLGLHRD